MISTKNIKNKISLTDAILSGMPLDKGLWIPENINKLDNHWIDNIDQYSNTEICYKILEVFFSKDIPKIKLQEIVNKSINFEIPLHKLDTNDYILELIHGPTMAFKDFGARIMAQIYQYFISEKTEKYRIIVATSGDTGGAVANAFSLTNVPVTIFYPKDRVSTFQEKQITNYGKNISCFCIDGSFDDCQKIVKELLLDKDIEQEYKLITANSINIARLIPQIFYYFISYSKLKRHYGITINNYKLIYSVPSGNFGNVTAGYMSKLLGLPIDKLLIATNANDSLSDFLKTGKLNTKESIDTLSNAMDVGNPSNFERLFYLCNNDLNVLKKYILTETINDIETVSTIKDVFIKYKYLLDPHTAVGYKSINNLEKSDNTIKVTLATASPYKFKKLVENSIKQTLDYPKNFKEILDLKSLYLNYHSSNKDIFKKLIEKKIIILIGMPGSGKSTIAESLSKIFDWNLIETDNLIINKFNKKLVNIVSELKDKFTEEETKIILDIKDLKHNTVVSTGGSVVYSFKAMEYLSKIGVIIHLDTNFDDISSRVKNYFERGIVIKKDETFFDLFNNRKPLYEKYRNISINNSQLNINETTNIINNLF